MRVHSLIIVGILTLQCPDSAAAGPLGRSGLGGYIYPDKSIESLTASCDGRIVEMKRIEEASQEKGLSWRLSITQSGQEMEGPAVIELRKDLERGLMRFVARISCRQAKDGRYDSVTLRSSYSWGACWKPNETEPSPVSACPDATHLVTMCGDTRFEFEGADPDRARHARHEYKAQVVKVNGVDTERCLL